MAHESSILPSITSVISSADKQKKEEFSRHQFQKPDFCDTIENKEEVLDVDLSNVEANPTVEEKPIIREETIKMIKKHYEFIQVSRNVTTEQFLVAAAQLCHMDTSLAEHMWLALFPKLWAILEDDQRSVRLYNYFMFYLRNILLFSVFGARNVAFYHIWNTHHPEGLSPERNKYFRGGYVSV